MIVYYLSYLFFCISLFILACSLRGGSYFIGFAIILVFESVFIGCRSVDVGNDSLNYVEIFKFSDRVWEHVEIGYIYLLKLIGYITDSEKFFLVIHAILLNLILLYSFKLWLGKNASLAFLIFMSTHVYWLIHIQVLRNGVASALFLLFLSGYLNRKKIVAATGLLTTTIHYTSFIPLALSLYVSLLKKISNYYLRYFFIIILLISMFLLQNSFVFLSLDHDGVFAKKVADNIHYMETGSMAIVKVGFYYLITLLVILTAILNQKNYSQNEKTLFFVYLAIIAASLVFWEVTLFRDRIYLYAQLMEPVLLVLFITRGSFYKLKVFASIISSHFWALCVIFIWGPANILTHY